MPAHSRLYINEGRMKSTFNSQDDREIKGGIHVDSRREPELFQ